MYKTVAKILPQKFRDNLKILFQQSKLKSDPESLIGFLIVSSVGIGILMAITLTRILKINFFVIALAVAFAILATNYMILLVKSNKISTQIELVLPDALQLMSGNLRAGMTTDRALLLSARDEFGPLKAEFDTIGKEITSGKELDVCLVNMTKRIRSSRLEKSIYLIVSGLRAGGELADLLDQTAENLRSEKFIDEKVRSNVMMYVIFIFVAVGIGAPMLFGLSSYLVEVMSNILGGVDMPDATVTSSLPMAMTKVSIQPEFIIRFSIIALLVSSFMGGMIIGLISKGNSRDGFKYIPVLIGFSLTVFFVSRYIVKGLLSTVFTGAP